MKKKKKKIRPAPFDILLHQVPTEYLLKKKSDDICRAFSSMMNSICRHGVDLSSKVNENFFSLLFSRFFFCIKDRAEKGKNN